MTTDDALWPRVYAELTQRLAQAGFDLCAALTIDDQLVRDTQMDFERFGLATNAALVVANSRQLWPHFEAHLAASSAAKAALAEHPLDDYTEHSVRSSAQQVCEQFALRPGFAAYFSYATYPTLSGTRSPLPLQRLVQHSGLAGLGPCHLNIHDRYGPWIGLRALLILPLPAPRLAAREPEAEPCAQCSLKPCVPALRAALEPTQPAGSPPRWQRWLAVRDACPVGRQQRYGEAQIRFHYRSLGAPPLEPQR